MSKATDIIQRRAADRQRTVCASPNISLPIMKIFRYRRLDHIDVDALRGYRVTCGHPVPHLQIDRRSNSCCVMPSGTSLGLRVTVCPQSQHFTSICVMPGGNSSSVIGRDELLDLIV
jgi:hypothetical protein